MHSKLATLRVLLSGLPPIVPFAPVSASVYNFHDFSVSDDDISDLGLLGAVNRELEVRLGDRTKRGDTFELRERGPGVEALADVLQRYIETFPGNTLLEKWIDDACRAAHIVYADAGVTPPTALSEETSQVAQLQKTFSDCRIAQDSGLTDFGTTSTLDSPSRAAEVLGRSSSSDSSDPEADAPEPRKKNREGKVRQGRSKNTFRQAALPSTAKRSDTKVLESYEDSRYPDAEEDKDSRAGGGKIEPLLLKVSRPYIDPGSDKKRVRCLASSGCNQTWTWPRNQQRILVHSAACTWLPGSLRNDARHLLAAKAAKKTSTPVLPVRRTHSDDSEPDNSADTQSTDPRGRKRARTASESPAPSATRSHNGSFAALFVSQGAKDLKNRGDQTLIRYIVCNGIPPRSVDSVAFKDFVTSIQPKYSPPSATTLRDRLIPNEAARIQVALYKDLATLRNLTLSFDGGKTRRPHGIYTVSITIAESRKSYLVDLNDASRVSHTARYIVQEVLKPVLEKIPPENVSAVVSDNTGNTRKSRELLLRLFPHILNFQDCCHEMNLALLQINELAEFKDMVQDVKEILSYMHHSTYAMEEYNKARSTLKISTGLAHIGATRFWTYVSAVESVFKGLPAFRALVEDPKLLIDIASKNELFGRHSIEAKEFEIKLVKYLAVTTPFARAIKCLESAHATASDVYAYWVAIMSRLEFLMSKNSFKLQTRTMEDIRAIANQRFNELLEDGPEDVYLAAFFLDPRYRAVPVLERGQTNPLAIPPIRIQRDPLSGAPTIAERAKSPQTARDQLIARIGKCLQGILLREYGGKEEVDRSDIRVVMEKRNPLLAAFSPVEAYEQLRSQLYAYADKESPFKRQLKAGESVLQWWMKIQKDDDAKVLGALAIKIFSVVPHSMADERIMSTITWLNSARRSGQQVHTIADHLTIRQHHMNTDPRYAQEARRKSAACVRRWRDLEPTIRGDVNLEILQLDTEDGAVEDEDEYLKERAAVEALRDGAKLGELDKEQRHDFVMGTTFDLASDFLREMLADDGENGREAPGPSHRTAQGSEGNDVASDTATASATIRPSQIQWDQWA